MTIEQLSLQTVNLEQQLRFYRDILQLPVRHADRHSFVLQTGYTEVHFTQDPKATPYHMAMHISAHSAEKALTWLESRTGILRHGKDQIIAFPNWKARSIYFYDADKNILEFISRDHLFPGNQESFSSVNIEGVAEIGVASGDVSGAYEFLNANFELAQYWGSGDDFRAVGDDLGLFILVNSKMKNWFPSEDPVHPSPFEITFRHAAKTCRVTYQNERLIIL